MSCGIPGVNDLVVGTRDDFVIPHDHGTEGPSLVRFHPLERFFDGGLHEFNFHVYSYALMVTKDSASVSKISLFSKPSHIRIMTRIKMMVGADEEQDQALIAQLTNYPGMNNFKNGFISKGEKNDINSQRIFGENRICGFGDLCINSHAFRISIQTEAGNIRR
jgi:hypothetical protein